MSATDPHDIPHDTPPGLLDGLGPTVLRAIEPFDSQPMLGLPDAAKPAVIAALAARHDGPVLVLTPTPTNAADLVDALRSGSGKGLCPAAPVSGARNGALRATAALRRTSSKRGCP